MTVKEPARSSTSCTPEFRTIRCGGPLWTYHANHAVWCWLGSAYGEARATEQQWCAAVTGYICRLRGERGNQLLVEKFLRTCGLKQTGWIGAMFQSRRLKPIGYKQLLYDQIWKPGRWPRLLEVGSDCRSSRSHRYHKCNVKMSSKWVPTNIWNGFNVVIYLDTQAPSNR